MDPASIVEDTGGQVENSIPHPNFVAGWGVGDDTMIFKLFCNYGQPTKC